MILAQVSDPHITDAEGDPICGIDASGRLARVLAAIAAFVPRIEGVVLSGDLVERGTDAEYRRLAEIVAVAGVPCWLMVGNHDDRAALVRVFPSLRANLESGRLRYVVELGELRLVLLDSLVPGKPGGELDGDQLSWLDGVLSSAPTPAIVFVHHPPPTTGLHHVDRSALGNAGELMNLLLRHPQVVRVACGHLHQGMVVNWAGTTLSSCPSTAHGFALDLADTGRSVPIWSPAAFHAHRWYGGALHTYTVAVD